MKKITAVLLMALSFGATAEGKEASQSVIDARCLTWGSAAGLSENELMPFKISVRNNLDENEQSYEFGVASGILRGITFIKGNTSRQKEALYIYSLFCITAK
ncbi:MAG: hypothetical protein GY804_04260 [Alphaproteobacteria bacterium]|nr:hypothetical protein [Alphaproteobacteria bacterium]